VQIEAWAPFAEGKHDIFRNERLRSRVGLTAGQLREMVEVLAAGGEVSAAARARQALVQVLGAGAAK